MKASSQASLFAVEAHDERVCMTDLDKSSRSACAIIAGMRRAFVRAYLHKGKKSLVMLLRITRKLTNIDCRQLKSCATMTARWGLLSAMTFS